MLCSASNRWYSACWYCHPSRRNETTDERLSAIFQIILPIGQRIITFPGVKLQNNEIETACIQFKNKELNKMPKEFKKEFKCGKFKCGKFKAAVRKRNNIYEIRCMINGRNISASSKELATAKQKFIDKLVNPQNDRLRAKNKKNDLLLESYLIKWLEATKKTYVKENTYKSYLQTVNIDILPKFGNKKLPKYRHSISRNI